MGDPQNGWFNKLYKCFLRENPKRTWMIKQGTPIKMGNLHVQMEDSSSAIWPTTPEVFSAQRIIATATGPCCEMYLIPVGREKAGNHELQTLGQIAHGIIWNNMEQHGIIPVEENWIQLTCFDNHAEDLSVLVRMPRRLQSAYCSLFWDKRFRERTAERGPTQCQSRPRILMMAVRRRRGWATKKT